MDIQGLGNTTSQKSYQTNSGQLDNKTKNETKPKYEGEAEYIPSIQEKTVLNAIETANKRFEGKDKELAFSVHEKTKQIMVKIIDKKTKEVIKEIPPEKILDMVASMCEAAGIFVDEKR